MRGLEDWSLVPAAEMAELYRRDALRWRNDLDWDTAAASAALERARCSGHVNGLVVRQANGAIAGWTYFLLRGSELQIGALTASSPLATRALLDGVFASPAAAVARRALCFAYSDAPGVTTALTEHGFDVGAEYYLMRALDPVPGPAVRSLRPWVDSDVAAVAEVLHAAYRGPDARRAFVPSGALPEWRDYVRQLAGSSGCGAFVPSLSPVAPGDGRLDGVALVTRVSTTSAHLAQLAVRPEARGQRLGARLLDRVMGDAARAGFARLSLLVSETNERARRLYDRAGFTTQGSFLNATRSRQHDARRRGAPAA
ncbi:MAG: GNAT family N-acetyltransferase [Acidobacteriota bacterium]